MKSIKYLTTKKINMFVIYHNKENSLQLIWNLKFHVDTTAV